MQLQTVVECGKPKFNIGYHDSIISIGSCFADNIGNYLHDTLFDIIPNPFGVMYNPISVLNTLHAIETGKEFQKESLIHSEGLYHSMDHHGCFSQPTADHTLSLINQTSLEVHKEWEKCSLLLITFGTAWVYRYKSNDKVVANCHKLPASLFERELLSVEQIAELWIKELQRVTNNNPKIKIIFTVSPIRHWKDGAHGNQISKSTLLLAIEKIIDTIPNADYFPAYEIMMDELRDYRFYAEDMNHPSQIAIQYIRERFCSHFMDKENIELLKRAEQCKRLIEHRPLHPNNEEWQRFCTKRDNFEADLKRDIEKIKSNGTR